MRMLIADSDADFLERAQRFFTQCGHELRTAPDGIGCVAALRQFTPDVVALDTDLQWGGGEGVIAWMCERPGLKQVPIVWISNTRRRGASTPANLGLRIVGRLAKPFRLSELLALIESDRRTTMLPQTSARVATGASRFEDSSLESDVLS